MANYILADNQDLTRFATETLIRQKDAQCVIRRATDKAGLVLLLKETENAVVVIDFTLFDIADEEQLLIISERFAMASWILLSDDLTDRFLRRLVYSSTAFSIVFKSEPLSSVRDALLSATARKRYISQLATEALLRQQQEEEKEDHGLTSTEIEIVKAIAHGMTTKEIAAERFSSVHTITTHRKNIFRKLKVNTAHEVFKYALRAGLVNPSEFCI
ncbi:MAG: response regulator transcription factor [Prevotella sp.]|nr:response regulator transcription factor [Prevotella sp.]